MKKLLQKEKKLKEKNDLKLAREEMKKKLNSVRIMFTKLSPNFFFNIG